VHVRNDTLELAIQEREAVWVNSQNSFVNTAAPK
jgi:hypothetical protein